MDQKVIFEGKAFVSFFTDSDHQQLELVNVFIVQLDIEIFELRCPKQQTGTSVLITSLGGLSMSGPIIMQASGITRFRAR
ncbi:hypothetical protein [Pseudomonas sp. PDM13]|uniref:hypothetical protein n=1 Tax=Pseudomonas sp. PDM13 TaxID=2769255 RepID=UPI0021DFE3DB|nr:hypothetical protein [Pseudomonas sp. PDM13]MCU9949879.1 hypothetical protein [Pseudomonas sp. PDM13]